MTDAFDERTQRLIARVDSVDVDPDIDDPIPVEVGRDADGWYLGFHEIDDETGYQSGPYTAERVDSLIDALNEVLSNGPTQLYLHGLSVAEATQLLDHPALRAARDLASGHAGGLSINGTDVPAAGNEDR